MFWHSMSRHLQKRNSSAMESLKKIYPNVVVPQHGRGYFGIGIHCPKVTKNIGTLWRTAHILGADFMFIIGKRYENMSTDTRKSWRHVPLFEYPDYETFRSSLPKDRSLSGSNWMNRACRWLHILIRNGQCICSERRISACLRK